MCGATSLPWICNLFDRIHWTYRMSFTWMALRFCLKPAFRLNAFKNSLEIHFREQPLWAWWIFQCDGDFSIFKVINTVNAVYIITAMMWIACLFLSGHLFLLSANIITCHTEKNTSTMLTMANNPLHSYARFVLVACACLCLRAAFIFLLTGNTNTIWGKYYLAWFDMHEDRRRSVGIERWSSLSVPAAQAKRIRRYVFMFPSITI